MTIGALALTLALSGVFGVGCGGGDAEKRAETAAGRAEDAARRAEAAAGRVEDAARRAEAAADRTAGNAGRGMRK